MDKYIKDGTVALIIGVIFALIVFAINGGVIKFSERTLWALDTMANPGISTTRDPEYQRANREAAERAKARGELPMGLVLPNGRTVEEELRMGNQYQSDK